jgi:hypothetical protein
MLACVSLWMCCPFDGQISVQVVLTGICKHVAMLYPEFSCNYVISLFPCRQTSLLEKQIGIYITYRINNNFEFMQLKKTDTQGLILWHTFFLWGCHPTRVMTYSFTRFIDHTHLRTKGGRTPLDEWSARRRDLYLTTHNTHNRITSIPRARFEPTISTGERPQTHALDRAATGIGTYIRSPYLNTYGTLIHRNWFPLDPYKSRRIFLNQCYKC